MAALARARGDVDPQGKHSLGDVVTEAEAIAEITAQINAGIPLVLGMGWYPWPLPHRVERITWGGGDNWCYVNQPAALVRVATEAEVEAALGAHPELERHAHYFVASLD